MGEIEYVRIVHLHCLVCFKKKEDAELAQFNVDFKGTKLFIHMVTIKVSILVIWKYLAKIYYFTILQSENGEEAHAGGEEAPMEVEESKKAE